MNDFRIGHGYDIHRLQPGGKLTLGGVVVAEGISPVAHSDGDVVIHAIVDAILGALGAGDIGEHFPDTNPAYKGAASVVFLERIKRDFLVDRWTLVNVDVTILAERPRLKSFKCAMTQCLQNVLGGQVNVKAGTNETCDAIGAGQAIAAHAAVLLRRAEARQSDS